MKLFKLVLLLLVVTTVGAQTKQDISGEAKLDINRNENAPTIRIYVGHQIRKSH